MMKNKYIVLFIQNVQDFLIYRTRLIITVLSSFVAPMVMLWILSSLPNQLVNGMNKNQLISYYLTTSILYLFMNSKIDSYVKESIQQGEIANYLVKPINFWFVAFVKDISGRFVKLAFGLPLFAFLIFVYSVPVNFNLSTFGVTIIMLTIAFLLAFSLSFSLGLLAFWVEELWGLQNVKEVSIVLLSGIALPYSFFPDILQRILVYSPFPYLVNWPLHEGFSGNLLLEFSMAILWLVISLLSNFLMWKNGIKKYSALGTY